MIAVSSINEETGSLRNKYLETDQFLELAARRQFGKAAPGETELLIPKSVALAHTVDPLKTNKTIASTQTVKRPTYQRHFQAWIDFFLHLFDKTILI